jgi:Holliday junction resolvase RusA-like endonuclease
MLTIRLRCPGQPVSAKNHQAATLARGKGGRLVPVVRPGKAITSWYDRVVPVLARQFAQYQIPALSGPLHITVHQVLENDPLAVGSPDGDNVQSGVWDALQKAGVIENDRQFVAWAGTRTHGDPHVLVEIRRLAA